MTCPQTHVAEHRTVFTLNDPWPVGVLTGHPTPDGGFSVEHVIALQAGALPRLLKAGLHEAWARGYLHVTIALPDAFPKTHALSALGLRLGFDEYERRDGWTFLVKHRESA